MAQNTVPSSSATPLDPIIPNSNSNSFSIDRTSSRPAATMSTSTSKPPPPLDSSNYPNGKKSLAGISLRAFLLGTTLGLSSSLTIVLRFLETPLWRIPFFLASLALFHFLEYYVTAAYNTRYANISAFLLSSNGWAYNVAHISAALECLLAQHFWPTAGYLNWGAIAPGLKIQVALGLVLMIIGQVVRTLAMVQAGSNFNHTVQVERKEDHRLVTHGIYSVLRHPSYFGFFWWGLGTQLVLGNVVCFMGYTLVLWRFFSSRIFREEKFLIAFFGDDYVEYKKRSWVGIPGIH
ncbi:prenyl cysteine carboxyl methyltransferase Ste14 [Aspergillus nomiae NRRL 13137]|uniref:Protein-S-isoprenylcysteine O-methyltransferase n=1 Tax=Aspergillus nomiae NRRL (strain ATCC 15546 / NRRL 13137 / CBS 260.88 / M93) TaxID=1509407 RepID=A0A0L1IVP3_ASPN3|nr:prenyl cysteine carboxyl methyltransferase Ste14 [Aspergillus nomiae NRRL 13137]KNG83263.1 prenyl cysteine carboxyl methyltransferase Ste14 [Aspergillus nomiae NRRL 13137]